MKALKLKTKTELAIISRTYIMANWHYFIAILFSVIAFGYVYGFSIVNPLNNSWVLEPGDRAQHYIGWETFRDSPLSLPIIGENKNIAYPNNTSIAMTDSLPLLAIPLKIVDKAIGLPEGFQYIGFYGILSFIMMAILSALIIFRLTKSKLLSLLSSIFFITSPIMLFRMFSHTALASHWIILYTIYLLITYQDYKNLNWLSKARKWVALIAISSLLHPYLNFIILIIFAGYLFKNLINNKSIEEFLMIGGAGALTEITSYTVVGMFLGGGDGLSDFGFGQFSVNLLGLLNPMNTPETGRQSLLLKGFSGPTQYQYEGFMYLGAGIIIMLLVILGCNYRHLFSKQKIINIINKILSPDLPLVLAFSFLASYALSNRISLLNKEIIIVDLPSIIIKSLSIFRASGRLFWPIYYLIMICVIYYFSKIFRNKRIKHTSLIFMLVVQLLDISPRLHELRSQFNSKQENHFKTSAQWEKIIKDKKHFVFIDGISTNFELIAPIATNIDATISTANIARGNYQEIDKYAKSKLSDVMNNSLKDDEIYLSQDRKICSDVKKGIQELSTVYTDNIDGFCVITRLI